MGRPLHKKFFGNRNIGSTSTTADDGIGGQGVASVTLGGTWTGFTLATTTVTFSAPQLPNGVTATGTATIVGDAITAIVITEKGSGYTSIPTVTIADSDAGAEVTGTATAVLTVDTGAPGSATNQENAITITGRVVAGSTVALDVIKQTGARRYLVTDGTNTGVVELVGDAVDAAGEANIIATDSAGGTYYVTKITAHRALVVPGTGTQFPLVNSTAQSIPWVLDTAVLNTSVRVANA
jgi:hypothetical protein